jgi:hypothetical protein
VFQGPVVLLVVGKIWWLGWDKSPTGATRWFDRTEHGWNLIVMGVRSDTDGGYAVVIGATEVILVR